MMQSGKQKRTAIMARRKDTREKAEIVDLTPVAAQPRPYGHIQVDPSALAPNNSYGAPQFVERGFYVDLAFNCRDCGARQVWSAEQQQWWYETAKGYVYSTAVRCLACRRARQAARCGKLNPITKVAA